MGSAQETLIAVASASRRVIDASVTYARDKNDRNVNLSRARLGGELHRIVAASGTLLKETLQHSSPVDDRLKNWLFSDEPRACLDSLQTMEKLIRSSSRRVASMFGNPFSSMPTDDKIKDAIRIFEKRKDCFHFLLTTDVWNHEAAAKGPLGCGLVDTLSTIQEVRFLDTDTSTPKQAQTSWTRSKVDRRQLYEILQWLDAWDCTAKHEDTLELRQPDTCTWLADSNEYNAWRRADDSFLWLHGKPGSGKSVLAAFVIDGLERTLHQGESLAFFYCDFRSERSTAAAEVMRSLLSQLLRGFRDIEVDPGDVLDSLAKEAKRNGSILSNAKRLAVLVSRAARRFTKQPLVVVDALDECEDIESLLNALQVLNEGGLRLFVTGRPLQVIKDGFSQLPWLSLENMSRGVSADIKLHIRRELDSHRRLRIADAILKKEIIRSLSTKASGMFRWIECQLNTLKRCVTTAEIREALESLPIGLDATYERILLAISREERGGAIVQRALVWLVVAFTPLRLCQIIEALSIDLDRRTLNPDIGPIHGNALLDALGSLVMHDEETDIVKLSHFSVKEYLLGKFSHQKRLYHIDQQDAHAQIVRQCMSYIGACLELERRPSKDLHQLLDYVLSCGFIHLGHIKPTRSILDAILALHSDVQQHPLQWEQMHKEANNPGPGYGLPSLKDDFVLFILIRYAPEPLLRLFLGRAPLKAKEGTNPLIYAVHHKIEHARTLLSCGAKLNRRGIFTTDYSHDCISGLPIEAAVREGDHTLIDLLLAEGSPIPDGLFSAALLERGRSTFHAHVIARLLQTNEFSEWATQIHDKGLLLRALDHRQYTRLGWPMKEDVVVMTRRLKQIGCDLSGHSLFIERLLRDAVRAGHISTIEYFLSESNASLPADILLEASRSKRFNGATIRFLVRNGVNVHVVSADETTALHLVTGVFEMEEDCLERTRILCEAGSDPSACNLEGETPIHHVASRGYISVVKYLLFVGASLPPDIILRATRPPMIRFLLEKGANPTIRAVNGDTVLHSVLLDYSTAWDDCLESAKIFLAAGCDPSIPNSAGQTALDVAVASGHISIVKYLLSLNMLLPSGILISALGSRRYVRRINPEMIKFLLDNGANIHVTTPDGDNALHRAAVAAYTWWDDNHYIRAVKILMDAGCDPSARNSDGETLFHVAVRHGRTDVIEYLFSQGVPLPSDILLVVSYDENNTQTIQSLIDKGADVRSMTADGKTPLHFAVRSASESSSLKFAKVLIDAGGDPSVLNSSHETPMHAAANEGYISVIDYLLSLCVPLPPDILLAALANPSRPWRVGSIVRFVIGKGADTALVTTNGDTVLHLALVHSGGTDVRLEATKILIDVGCDIHAHNSAGETPLCAAARGGHIAIIEYLVSQGASLPPNAFLAAASCIHSKVQMVRFLATFEGADVHVVAPNGDTVLHRAVASGDEEACLKATKVLISLGCDPSLPNLAGETPLHISARRHQISVVKYLLSQGIQLPFDVLLSAALRGCDSMFPNMGPIMRFLIREGANPCVSKDNGDTSLHVVLRYDIGSSMWGWDAIQILLDGGANPYARNLDGQTPIDLAEMAGSFFLKNFMRLVKNAKNVAERGT